MKYYRKTLNICKSSILLLFLVSFIVGCSTKEEAEYPIYEVSDNTELDCLELFHEGITYRPYGVFRNTDYRGMQIGVREDEKEAKICEVKGYDSSEWILESLNIGGGDFLWKAVGVAEVPKELEQFQEYDY